VQTLLSGDAEGLGLGSWLDVCTVGDGVGEELGDADTLSTEVVGGATCVRVEIPIAKAITAKTPPIAMGIRNLFGKVAEPEVVCELAKLDDKFPAGVGFVGARAGIGVPSGCTTLGVEDTRFSSPLISDCAGS
jgi:hypothetical protein